ncbi:MAG: F0F1 ATP synthase subunit B [Paludibacteraceae bacterium]|jgi:F-type H+-transporting ATPase subunit b|nr:F0F1 ATP synthase subunit B [Paludibacteraceae bacterium]NLK93037.1 F0F1 ATP synthase subunit B [Bacteroidales bacterium]OQA47683.1 MAG: ATP synthase subunit b [Bacteroidetes bacterium ADurb.Bin302]MBP6435950.1 F0F1 ATP synthase subunit B [Paludibacteraceae bacterium]MBP7219786.1 F0F1 ATP synthase subunit B [Paludibacteraceae bacterium]
MDLFLPESGLVIWMTIAFGIVFFILSKFGFPIILKSINEREKYIIKSLDAANEAQQKLLEIEDKGKEIIANAEQQQLLIVKESQELKKKLVEEAKMQAQKEADNIIANARIQIEKEKETALSDIRNEVLQVSLSIAEKVLEKELENKKAHTQYVEKLLDNMSMSQS